MRFAFFRVALATAVSAVIGSAHGAAPKGHTIDFDSNSPTLGELLDQEAREAAARRAAQQPKKPEPPKVQPKEDHTGSIPPRRVVQEPQLPRNAVTVILPHPRQGAGRPVPREQAPSRR